MSNSAERFSSKVNKTETCWLWNGTIAPSGYGRFYVNGKMVTAHRFSYELSVAPIPDGLKLDHTCHNESGCVGGKTCIHRRCVNPAHLEPVTHYENVLRGNGLTALNALKSHCAYGHPFDEANTVIGTSGRRKCRACNREFNRQRRTDPKYRASQKIYQAKYWQEHKPKKESELLQALTEMEEKS